MPRIVPKSKRSKSAPYERIEARIPRSLKKKLEKAAAVTGHLTLTSYVVHTLQSSAQPVIDQHERAQLSAQESVSFVETILAAAAPNAALKGAWQRYRAEARV